MMKHLDHRRKLVWMQGQSAATPCNDATDSKTTMIYTHVLNRGGHGVCSPADRLGTAGAEEYTETAYHPRNRTART